MSSLNFYNSLTKKKELFEPHEPGKVRMYHCGPTVYKRQHIGNMRRFLFADFLRRTLEMGGYEVREITNITDVGHLTQDDIDAGEDKMEKEAREKGISPQEIAEMQTRLFFEDLASLNIQQSHLYPRATQHVEHMKRMIQSLIDKGHAYTTPTGVYFDVTTFPAYGALSGNTLDTLQAGKRIDVREEKKHPFDFALWIIDPDHLQLWDSPWGKGYPGWHIECSAMSVEYLDSNIDIHTGGEDNRFPHHENEIAQSESATGLPFARFWMHNSHLQLKGKKLAKRKGEQITVDTIKEAGYSPLAFRLFIFSGHYRSHLEFDWEYLDSAQEHLASITRLLRRLHEHAPHTKATPDSDIVRSFLGALSDDLNTPKALGIFMEYVTAANKVLDSSSAHNASILATLHAMDHVLGIISPLEQNIEHEHIPNDVMDLVQKREDARKQKQFEYADELRDAIGAKGYAVEDTSSGPRVVQL